MAAPPTPPAYDLIVFDLDGTLIDSIGDIADALNDTLAARDIPPRRDGEVVPLVGAGAEELLRGALDVERHPEREAWIAQLVLDYRARYARAPIKRTNVYLGVREALAKLRAAGVQLAVATNKPGAIARQALTALKLDDDFEAVLGADDVGSHKPDPLIVDIVRGKLGTPRARTLYVGDSLIDAATADAAGVDLALVTYGYAPVAAIRARTARFHLDRFSQLLDVIFTRQEK